jgi:hypothetical protein
MYVNMSNMDGRMLWATRWQPIRCESNTMLASHMCVPCARQQERLLLLGYNNNHSNIDNNSYNNTMITTRFQSED